MNRRSLVVSGVGLCLSVWTAGCSDDGDDDEDEKEETVGDYRRVSVDSTTLRHRGDALVREEATAFVTVRIENTGTEPIHAKLTVQLLDSDEDTLGTPYTQRRGPIESGDVISVRFDLEQDPAEIVGYELVIDEATPS